ncbi:MAG: Mannosyl oligosaccharide glucosidase [Chthoniobacteraceae bacterium]|nr:Mannosyl oligosaccharide glucosidase [Chthoniobacteraceae bacterium]
MPLIQTPEHLRLDEDIRRLKNWKRWGPYLSERQWGTVREDYSAHGDAWNYFTHEHARSRAYRWGEDGLLGISDRQCRLCFGLALWNGRDPILKERLYGLSNPQGNHGEDPKEVWHYLDSTPTHSYMRALYKYPQAEFPYAQLVAENARRSKLEREFELEDTGIFDESRYFDVIAEYAKADANDLLIRITLANRGPEAAELHVLPTLWFRNTWSWGCTHEGCTLKPNISLVNDQLLSANHQTLDAFQFAIETGAPWLFTENESNNELIFGTSNDSSYVKDAFHQAVIGGNPYAVNARCTGTKAAPHYRLKIATGAEVVLRFRLALATDWPAVPFAEFDEIFAMRIAEANAFYETKYARELSAEQRNVVRQAYAGLLWSKQFYHYVVKDWLTGDPNFSEPPNERLRGRNHDWQHLFNADIISMPDKWEYPWYAAWDLAFHMIPMARVDPDFAKQQLLLFLREWYMHPSGAMPAYEWNLRDVNPPVHAWACWRVYKISGAPGARDRQFLERAFQKLLINFTWWVNRKDVQGKHIFSGGFLGLDNIGLFDRSRPLPSGQTLAQADGTAWMAFYCGTMLSIAIELARANPVYEDIASKFLEHLVEIVDAMNDVGGGGLWDEEDGFYYDQLLIEGRQCVPLRVRSLVGLLPLFAVEILEQNVINKLPGFKKRLKWYVKNRYDIAQNISYKKRSTSDGHHIQRLLAIPSRERLIRVLKYLLDENEFLSPHGIRSLSRAYKENPYHLNIDDDSYRISYEPGESETGMFGGNSNWRGPIWVPMNYLLIEALERYHHYWGDDLQVEFPTGSGHLMNLAQVAHEIARRLTMLFLPDEEGKRPCFGGDSRYANDPYWKDLVLFHEHFCGETGRGLGATHQTGWTALITRCMNMVAREEEESD